MEERAADGGPAVGARPTEDGADAGRSALVTGASSGIGLAIASMLVEEGYDLTIVSRTPDKLERAAAELAGRGAAVNAFAADLLDAERIAAAIASHRDRFGRLDVLVNNAGMGIHAELDDYRVKHVDLQLALNLRAVILVYREAVDLLRAAAADHRNALVVNMSSVVGKRGAAGLGVYSAAKHGLVGFTEAMNEELSGEGIKSCVLCPGFVDTELADYEQNPVPPAEMIRTADLAESVRSLLRLSPHCVVPEIVFTRPGREAVVSG
ncbi:MAG: SDR family oxidoreductase [Syntrophothermus sp.]